MHVLRLRDYRLYLCGRFFAAMSQQMLALYRGELRAYFADWAAQHNQQHTASAAIAAAAW